MPASAAQADLASADVVINGPDTEELLGPGWRARCRPDATVVLPMDFLRVPLTAVAGVGMSIATPLLTGMGFAPHGLLPFALGTGLGVALGHEGGRVLSETDAPAKVHQRGAVVDERALLRDALRHTMCEARLPEIKTELE